MLRVLLSGVEAGVLQTIDGVFLDHSRLVVRRDVAKLIHVLREGRWEI